MNTRSTAFSMFLVWIIAVSGGCGAAPRDDSADALVWAVNVAGPAYVARDGTSYVASEAIQGGTAGQLATVKGSQDSALYRDFQRGEFVVSKALENGRYDVTFHFAEPDEVEPGVRVFSAFVEDQPVIRDLDVMLFRDAKVHSALTVTVPGVRIDDRELSVRFEASAGEPVLSALVVRSASERKQPWKLAWSDEFDYRGAPDPARWNVERWDARKVNDEDQAYTDRPDNVRVEDGHLIIEARREDYDDARFTSARIQSQGKGDVLYGRVEVRAKLPEGKGTWPAIWMLPSDPFRYATMCGEGVDWQGNPDCDAWPNSGEIDIMEHVGYQMNHVHGTVHNKAYYWINWEQRKGRVLLDDVAEKFHVYALEWRPDMIEIFVDDTLYFTYANEGDGWRAWPFDHPFHLILNVAVGGYWGRAGGGIDESVFPQQMTVDYVRVYERAGRK